MCMEAILDLDREIPVFSYGIEHSTNKIQHEIKVLILYNTAWLIWQSLHRLYM